MEEVVESVVRKLLGSAGHGEMDLEALQGWLLKHGCHRKQLRISVEYFVEFLANQNPT